MSALGEDAKLHPKVHVPRILKHTFTNMVNMIICPSMKMIIEIFSLNANNILRMTPMLVIHGCMMIAVNVVIN